MTLLQKQQHITQQTTSKQTTSKQTTSKQTISKQMISKQTISKKKNMLTFFDKVTSRQDRGVRKYILRTTDGMLIESIYLNKDADKKIVLCLSSQTGCQRGCTFCNSSASSNSKGHAPITRDLTAEEMISQIMIMCTENQKEINLSERPILISFIGSGEPLDNLEEVMKAISIFRQIFDEVLFSIYTSAPDLKKIYSLANMNPKDTKLHLSLNASNDTVRRNLMPDSASISLTLRAAEYYKEFTGNKVELIYTLIDDINDLPHHADELASILSLREFHIKFTEFNPFPESKMLRSNRTEMFCKAMAEKGISVEDFRTLGDDILASCGQQAAYLMEAWKKNSQISIDRYV